MRILTPNFIYDISDDDNFYIQGVLIGLLFKYSSKVLDYVIIDNDPNVTQKYFLELYPMFISDESEAPDGSKIYVYGNYKIYYLNPRVLEGIKATMPSFRFLPLDIIELTCKNMNLSSLFNLIQSTKDLSWKSICEKIFNIKFSHAGLKDILEILDNANSFSNCLFIIRKYLGNKNYHKNILLLIKKLWKREKHHRRNELLILWLIPTYLDMYPLLRPKNVISGPVSENKSNKNNKSQLSRSI